MIGGRGAGSLVFEGYLWHLGA